MDHGPDPTDVVQQAFAAYLDQDRAVMERVLADDLVFTSPYDDHIDRDAYFTRCFPTADRLLSQVLMHVAAVDDDHVVSVYEYGLQAGGTFRNAELHSIRGGQIHEIQVFFGGAVGEPI